MGCYFEADCASIVHAASALAQDFLRPFFRELSSSGLSYATKEFKRSTRGEDLMLSLHR